MSAGENVTNSEPLESVKEAPPLRRLLCFLSCRNKKGRPPAGTGTEIFLRVYAQNIIPQVICRSADRYSTEFKQQFIEQSMGDLAFQKKIGSIINVGVRR